MSIWKVKEINGDRYICENKRTHNETWKVVCKTTDGTWTIYEIKQYPGQEYLVARAEWEARVLKHIK